MARRGQVLVIRRPFPIHERLREERLAAKITQTEVASRIGKPHSWVSRVESGEYVVPGHLLPAYAAALGVTIARLYNEHVDDGDAPLARAG